jgi:hypothetical protein
VDQVVELLGGRDRPFATGLNDQFGDSATATFFAELENDVGKIFFANVSEQIGGWRSA